MNTTHKNILVCFMSVISNDATEHPYAYEAKPNTDAEKSLQTNETGIRYLNSVGVELDKIFAYVTKEAAEKALPHLQGLFGADKFQCIDADQNDKAYDCLLRMADMMNQLQAYKKDNPDVQVHIDFTGGHRQASMLLLALFQMLKHQGYKLGRIIYTKFINEKQSESKDKYFIVEDASELLNMYTLISGTEEFARFGSAQQINEYFRAEHKTTSSSMQEVLNAMDDFSEKLKICSSQANMLQSIRRLSEALDRYNPADANDNKEKFFETMLPEIRKEYESILSERRTNKFGKNYYNDKNIFSLIYWCAQKGFLQQALTYYTEWIPEYLVKTKGWLVPLNSFDRDAHKFDNNQSNEWYDYLFTTYNQWNDKLKITRPTKNMLFNILNTNNLPRAKECHITLSQLIDSIADTSGNEEILSRFKAYQKQILDLQAAYNSKPIKNANCFADVVMAYYDDNVGNKSDCPILLNILQEFYKSQNNNYAYNNNSNSDKKYFKNNLIELYGKQKGAFDFNLFASEILHRISNRWVKQSRDKKVSVYAISRIFKLHDNIEDSVLMGPNFKSSDIIPDKGIPRDEMFASLLENGNIMAKSPLTDAKLIKLAGDYMKFKNEYRNRANHADFNGSKESNIRLPQEIIESVAPLCDFNIGQ